MKKLLEFVEVYKKDKKLDENEVKQLMAFFKDSLDKKKLCRVKDVVYDKVNGNIKEIPSLTYIKSTKHFTLKNMDKRVSTLKSLAPKKINESIKRNDITKTKTINELESNEK